MKKFIRVLACIAGALVIVRLVQNLVEFLINTFGKHYISSGE